MRILRVFARITLKILISPDTQDVMTVDNREWGDEKTTLTTIESTTLLGQIIATDDVQALRSLTRARLIPHKITDLYEYVISETGRNAALQTIERLEDLAVAYDAARILQESIKRGWQPTEQASFDAACQGSIAVLQCLEENDAPMDANLCVVAARTNQLKTLKWLHAHSYAWDENTTVAAARGGAIEILGWIKQQDTRPLSRTSLNFGITNLWPKDGAALMASVWNEEMKAFRWQLENDCPIPAELCSWLDHSGLINADVKREAFAIVEELGKCTCAGYHHYMNR